jgi:hypothetical protein
MRTRLIFDSALPELAFPQVSGEVFSQQSPIFIYELISLFSSSIGTRFLPSTLLAHHGLLSFLLSLDPLVSIQNP